MSPRRGREHIYLSSRTHKITSFLVENLSNSFYISLNYRKITYIHCNFYKYKQKKQIHNIYVLLRNFRKSKIYYMNKLELEKLKNQIGKLLQLYRLRKGLSQLQLGNELNLSSNHVGRIERAETNPTLENIVKICNFFEIDILYLFSTLNKNEITSIEGEINELKEKFKNQNKRKS